MRFYDYQTLYVQLGYSPAQGKLIIEHLEGHRVENGGRYKLESCVDEDGDESDEIAVTVFSHSWSLSNFKVESTIMCSFRYKRDWPGIGCIMVPRGFDWPTAWAELAVIEEAALGETIHGMTIADSEEFALSGPLCNMNSGGLPAEVVRLPKSNVSLGYSPTDFGRIVAYLGEHAFPFHGRYQVPIEITGDAWLDLEVIEVTVLSGRPSSPRETRPPVRELCHLRFDCGKQAINHLTPGEDADIKTAWAELATLEREALGTTIHGMPTMREQAR